MRAGQKKNTWLFFFGYALPKFTYNASAHLKQRKKHSGLEPQKLTISDGRNERDDRGGGGGSLTVPIACLTLVRRHQLVAQCCRNIQPSFNRSLCIQIFCLGFPCIHINVGKKYFNKSKNTEINKIMICGIHYFTTKLMSSHEATLI